MRLIAAALLWLLLACGAAADERIVSFRSSASVNIDASVDVTEQISVTVENIDIRHGIFRDFPTEYRTRSGQRMRVGFEVLEVRLDGEDVPYKEEGISGGRRIRIGDADSFVAPGPHTYLIRYRTTRQIGYFDTYDEFYWNVTGNGWKFPIDSASIVVDLPPGASIVQSSGYTGPAGAQGTDFRVTQSSGNRFAAETTGTLEAGEGFTIAVAWQKGIVQPPSEAEKNLWFLQDNGWLFTIGATLLLAACYYVAAWFAVGRDPPKAQVIPLFRPPQGFGPADVRYVWRQGADDKTFASALVGLAVKGLAHIDDDGSDYRVTARQNGSTKDLSVSEAALYKAMPGGSLTLKQSNHSIISRMQSALRDALAETYKGSYFKRNLGWFVAGAVFSIAGMVIASLLLPGDQGPVVLFASLWMAIWWGVIFSVIWASLKKIQGSRGVLRKAASAFTLLFLIPFVGAGLAVPGSILVFGEMPPEILLFAGLAVLLSAINLLFYYLLKAPTVLGQQVLGQIEGFRLYMTTAEEERLNALNPPEKTPELFERYLPYAIALNCENEWGEKFAAVLAAAAAAGAASAPGWYSGRNWDSRHPGDFASGLGKSFASTLASSATAPGSSSGSGGGGSSGGGGGGGGGGGW